MSSFVGFVTLVHLAREGALYLTRQKGMIDAAQSLFMTQNPQHDGYEPSLFLDNVFLIEKCIVTRRSSKATWRSRSLRRRFGK